MYAAGIVAEIGQIERFENEAQLAKSIVALFEVVSEVQCLKSIPGIGIVYAAGIVAEIGQIERFENEAQLAKYCGLYWKKNQSGNFESERTPMTRTGNQYSIADFTGRRINLETLNRNVHL